MTSDTHNEPILLCEMQGSTLQLTLNRPTQRNALDLPLREELSRAIHHARDDVSVKALVLTGAGGSFCAGGDIRSMREDERSAFGSRKRMKRVHHWMFELVNLEKPVIAAVDGAAAGGGFPLALAADFVLATPEARFSASFARVGLVPDMSSMYLLPRMVGLQRAKEILFSSRVITADEALDLGLVYEIHPRDKLLAKAHALAARFQDASLDALGVTKTILNQSFNLDQRALIELEASAQALAMSSEYHQQAVSRFLAKQKQLFSWDD